MDHYEIKIEGLKYGKIRKEFDAEYKQAISAYKGVQKAFKDVPCEIILNRVNIKDTGKKERKIEYKNYLGKDYVLENTTITPKLYAKKKREEWVLDAETALKLGVCDKIITDIDELY